METLFIALKILKFNIFGKTADSLLYRVAQELSGNFITVVDIEQNVLRAKYLERY